MLLQAEYATLLSNEPPLLLQVDIDKYMSLVGSLEEKSQAFVLKRVGWLASWNPCRPDGYFELALDRREERQVAKVRTSKRTALSPPTAQ